MSVTSPPSLLQRIGGYVALTKPRIIELLLVTTVPTMIVAEDGLPSLGLMAATVVGGTLAAGGANAANMYLERDLDRLMERTSGRPLVTGLVQPTPALVFAVSLELVAFAWLWALVNLASAALAAAAALFYVFVYTLWLKRTSKSNIVIGGAAGAAPVLIGWAAVTGSLDWPAVVLFGVVFVWTPPHFWALAIRYQDDYTAADVPMLPSVLGSHETAVRSLRYTIALVALTLAFAAVADMGVIYLTSAVVLGLLFGWMSWGLLRAATPERAMRVFRFSIVYLTLLFAAIAVDVLVRSGV